MGKPEKFKQKKPQHGALGDPTVQDSFIWDPVTDFLCIFD